MDRETLLEQVTGLYELPHLENVKEHLPKYYPAYERLFEAISELHSQLEEG